MRAYTVDALNSPVTTSELADWLRLDDNSDPLLQGLLIAATQSVIDYLQRDLLARDWTLIHECWPVRNRQLTSHNYSQFFNYIELPYAGALSVASVTVYGELIASTDYRVTNELPDRVKFIDAVYPVLTTDDEPALVIEYRAGFGELATDIPDAIKTALLMIAAYMYAHRGACEAAQAITMSGAATLLQPWRVRAGVVV